MVIKPQRKKKISVVGEVEIKRNKLTEVHSSLFVGIFIDEYLCWSQQITHVINILRKKVGIMYRLRHFIPKQVLLLLYHSFIQSHISYGLEVWGCAPKTKIQKIYIAQKTALRAMTFSSRLTPSSPLFHSLGILDVFKLYRQSVPIFIYIDLSMKSCLTQLMTIIISLRINIVQDKSSRLHSYQAQGQSMVNLRYHLWDHKSGTICQKM